MNEPITNYRETRAKTREALHRGVLDAASRVLVREGYTALTMRRVADEVGASTKVIYTLFENKDGLVNALYLEAVRRVRETLEAVPVDAQALDYLRALAQAYRAHVAAQPNDFIILNGLSLPDFTPSETAVQENVASFDIVAVALKRAMDAGELAQHPLESAGKALIGCLNGILSMEIGGHNTPEQTDVYLAFALETLLRGLQHA
ncbi:MAG: TetR/AcrR family transcriptional regulator [Chloroflexota bacterium]|nr:TetR/AcrR family transcriptional regulator [Chloroflexota bacterium]